MKNEMIAKVLKDYRKKRNMSVKEVCLKLENKSLHVAEKTLYGWENGQAQPDADTLLILCEIYEIEDILATFGYTKNCYFHVSQLEREIIKQLRKQPEWLNAIKKLLDVK